MGVAFIRAATSNAVESGRGIAEYVHKAIAAELSNKSLLSLPRATHNVEVMIRQLDRDHGPPLAPSAPAEDNETLGAVIASQARTRTSGELWTTAAGGTVNALLLWLEFPSLLWLAAGFTGVAAYGLWGLTDRQISTLELSNKNTVGGVGFLKLARGIAGVAGWIAAIAAVIVFLNAAVGGLSMPGR
jgi:hypothetical protein